MAGRQSNAAFDDIFELPNIAGEIIVQQVVHGIRADLGDFPPILPTEAIQKMQAEDRNVLAALPKRR